MTKPKRYRGVETFRRVGLLQISREINRTPTQTRKLLAKVGFVGLKPRRRIGARIDTTYDASALEVVKAMLSIPHRPIPDLPKTDWLATYEGAHDDDTA